VTAQFATILADPTVAYTCLCVSKIRSLLSYQFGLSVLSAAFDKQASRLDNGDGLAMNSLPYVHMCACIRQKVVNGLVQCLRIVRPGKYLSGFEQPRSSEAVRRDRIFLPTHMQKLAAGITPRWPTVCYCISPSTQDWTL